MAGRILTPDELWFACQGYAKSHGLEPSRSENGSITLMPGDILVSLRDGKMQCGDPDIALSIMECLPEATRGANLAVRGSTGINTSQPPMNAAQAIQTMQAGKGLTYQVNKKPAPTATMALMAATDAKVNLTEVASALTDELASSTIRATAKNGRSVDATVSIRKADFINLLAWKEVDEQEKLKNPILDDSDPMNIALPNGFPRIKPDAMVMIRVKTKESNLIEKRRAIVHIYITAMQQWIFQQRQCQTKAKRNAIIQLLTSSGNPTEVMDEDELADEERERQMVAEAA